ncbi:hypothetical protein [Roseateles oligotrophus]|uniref:Uncharacterized protein n=1 Tax=Roseateles oligotrophus TaxID=1769250 RepID=A0ABT2YMT7_9BURK|nr:hypothetical protein [Roseateles oligotrophus]MCV2371369.1 hypothetical protein [Roseateles oligotrophus]
MAGILALAAALIWALVCAIGANLFSRLFGGRLRQTIVGIIAFLALISAPFVDVALGTAQFNDLCAKSDNLRLVGTIASSSSTGLYTESGEWKLAVLAPNQFEERHALSKKMDSLVRWEGGNEYKRVSRLFPIYERPTQIYEASSNRLLAEFKSYHYGDGLFRSQLLGSGKQCFPWTTGHDLYKTVFVFHRSGQP